MSTENEPDFGVMTYTANAQYHARVEIRSLQVLLVRAAGCGKVMKMKIFEISFILFGMATMALPIMVTPPAMADDGEIQPGFPTRRSGGGRRSYSVQSQVPSQLAALVPQEANCALTSLPKPTFYFYVPALLGAEGIEFVVRDQTDTLVFETLLPPSQQSGIVALDSSLYEDFPELQVNQDYHWYFSLVEDSHNRAMDTVLEGWIKRVQTNVNLGDSESAGTDLVSSDFPASQQLWYDALREIAQLRHEDSKSTLLPQHLQQQWSQVLGSVGLGHLASAPFLEMPKPGFSVNAALGLKP
jgi:hypothetical protein